MNRRQFIIRGAFAGLTTPYLLSGACGPRSAPNPGEPGSSATFPFEEVTITALQEKMKAGEVTARTLVELYLERIREIDQEGVTLRSVIEINPDALRLATALDEERRSGVYRGMLHGIPFLVKDNIDTGDKMMTTAGSLALLGHHAKEDAPLVAQLRAAGAILLGKTNLSEWANFRSTRSSSGWSSRGGQTRNPYSLERNPCGSSSGSGVAVAANLCSFAIGTETNGSISCPSSVNGIVGLKPTVGLVSRTGIIPISITQDTAGPMTRTVEDTAIVLAAIAGKEAQDAATDKRPNDLNTDYLSALSSSSLAGKRIGVEKSFVNVHEGVDRLLADALTQMRQAGATIIEVSYKDKLKAIGENEYKLLRFEFKDGLNRYLQNSQAPVRLLQEVIDFNKANADKMMPFFGQEILIESQAMGETDSPEYTAVRESVVSTARKAIDGTLQEYQLDALCGPATGAAWCTDLVNGNSFSGYGMGSGAAMAGYPSITVPLGDLHGLPVGLLFMSSAFREPQLLAVAHGYERASRNRKPPLFRHGLVDRGRILKEQDQQKGDDDNGTDT